jgi:outer membrane receptor for ferric coprogen and ferric-rhodotorulic acid
MNVLVRFAVVCPAIVATALAQALSRPETSIGSSSPGASKAAVVMSPFEVNADEDQGYAASSALSGTRTNEKLANLPNSISVITADLISDLALNDMFDAVEFAVGAENIYSDYGTVGVPAGTRYGNQISFRGVPSLRPLRDGFPWFLPQDNYNTERIEFSRGPSGLAYGDVDPAGIINLVTKRANFRRRASTSVRYDNFGTQRYSADINQPLHPRLAVRFNAVNSEVEQFRQRASRDWRGYAGALRWVPFKDGRTRLDLNYETAHTRINIATLQLSDNFRAYIPGSGTSALDANPTAPGVQINGNGMRRTVSPGNARTFFDIHGVLYDMQSTATTTYRNSAVLTGATVASGADPQNPMRHPTLPVSFSVIPEGQDWTGPDNRHDTDFHSYSIELSHSIGEHLRVLLAHNGQVDDSVRVQAFAGPTGFGVNSRAVFIDVNRVLPDPNVRGGTIPNPRFEQLFVAYSPSLTEDGNRATGWRSSAVFDSRLPFWNSSIRAVVGATYRHELNYRGGYLFALTREEIARRNYAGAAATYPNNIVQPVHYLADGNSDEALRLRVVPGVTTWFRSGTQSHFDQTLGSGSFSTLGSFFSSRLHTSVGITRDYFRQNRNRTPTILTATGESQLVDLNNQPIANPSHYNIPFEPFNRRYSTNQTYGGVFRVRPWLAVSGGYFESSLFTDSVSFELTGRPRSPRTGEGHDFSLRFNFLDGRINAAVTRFVTIAEKYPISLSTAAQAELNRLLPADRQLQGPGDYYDVETKGWELELQANVTRNWTLRGSLSMHRLFYGSSFPLVGPFLETARAVAQSRGLDPDDATRITQQFIEDTETSARASRRVTANLATRYRFSDGRLKGVAVGVSARYALGKPQEALSSGGVVVIPASRTDDTVIVSPSLSYRRRFFGLNWSLQLNVNNVFDLHSNQGNTPTWPRYTVPRQYVTTATVEF